jgi:hypothetical protein
MITQRTPQSLLIDHERALDPDTLMVFADDARAEAIRTLVGVINEILKRNILLLHQRGYVQVWSEAPAPGFLPWELYHEDAVAMFREKGWIVMRDEDRAVDGRFPAEFSHRTPCYNFILPEHITGKPITLKAPKNRRLMKASV